MNLEGRDTLVGVENQIKGLGRVYYLGRAGNRSIHLPHATNGLTLLIGSTRNAHRSWSHLLMPCQPTFEKHRERAKLDAT